MKVIAQLIFSFIKKHYRYINKVLLFVLSLVLIVLFTPKDVKFRYEYHIGKPWLHNDLIAPFDFSIYKTEAETEAEKAALLSNFKPFYSMDTTVASVAISSFVSSFDSKWESSYGQKPEATRKEILAQGKNILSAIFEAGIIDKKETDVPTHEHIYIIADREAWLAAPDTLYTIQTANNAILKYTEDLPERYSAFLTPLIQAQLTYNIFYDASTSEKNRAQLLENLSLTRGLIQNGEKIISKGELVTPEKYRILESLKIEHKKLVGGSYRYHFIVLGHIIITALLLLVVFLFIYNFRRNIFENNKKLFFIILQLVLMVVITKIIVGYDIKLLYAIPVCITPIIIRAFFDTRLAIFIHVVSVIIISSFAPNSYEFILYHMIAGIVAVLSIIHMNRRAQLFFTSFYIFATYVTFYIGFLLIFEGSLNNFDSHFIGQFAVSAVLNLLAFPLIFLYEKLFGYVTDFSLMELSNTNSPLLRLLASKAPGTFQHSMQVANMAEEAAYECDGNPLLVRAGALYHDIGKIDNPEYFTENQAGGYDPHEVLSYKESAEIIIGHVIRGIETSRKYRIPEFIVDFIRTHHGTKKTGYFYSMYKQEHKEHPDDAHFSYNGPLPFSKETAILMFADAVEAASRSLKTYDDESIDNLVDQIVDGHINENQLVNSDLSFKDISIIRKIFKQKLKNIYHVRVAYPTAEK